MQFYPTPCHYSPYVQIFSLCSFIQPPAITPLMSRYSHYAVFSSPLPLLPLSPDIFIMQFFPTPCHYSSYVQIFSLGSFIKPPAITPLMSRYSHYTVLSNPLSLLPLCPNILTMQFYPTPCHYSPCVQIFSLCSFIQPPAITPLMSKYSHYAVLSNRLPLPPYVKIFSLYGFIQPPAIILFYFQIFFQHLQTLSPFYVHSNQSVQRQFCIF